MAEQGETPKPIVIFLASPSDVKEEREALTELVREINDVLAFLATSLQLRLELVKYETHTYPDIGQAQTVINHQIPDDYDIFVGIMWKRFGTPTATAGSGTVEEFNRALDRRQRTSRPTIMFYFCDEPVPMPKKEELEQLAKVIEFREELEQNGLTSSYPTRKQFRDSVRGGLLRAVSNILASRRPNLLAQRSTESTVAAVSVEASSQMELLARAYDKVRRDQRSGPDRTREMRTITAEMRATAAMARGLLKEYQGSDSPGARLAAICILQQFPQLEELGWLADRLNPENETPFVGYAAAVALAQAVPSLPESQLDAVGKYLERALALAELNPNDPPRINTLRRAIKDLKVRKEFG